MSAMPESSARNDRFNLADLTCSHLCRMAVDTPQLAPGVAAMPVEMPAPLVVGWSMFDVEVLPVA